jgi:hypothetical protein
MRLLSQLFAKREGGITHLAHKGTELPQTQAAPAVTAAQAFGHGVLTRPAPRMSMKLAKDQVWRIQVEETPLNVRAVRGSVWITVDGDGRDHLIDSRKRQANRCFDIPSRAHATLSALEDSEIEVS